MTFEEWYMKQSFGSVEEAIERAFEAGRVEGREEMRIIIIDELACWSTSESAKTAIRALAVRKEGAGIK